MSNSSLEGSHVTETVVDFALLEELRSLPFKTPSVSSNEWANITY